MKKLMIFSLAILLGGTFCPALAKDKKKKTPAKVEQASTSLQLSSPNDTLAYSAGYTLTTGLDSYLKQQFNLSDDEIPFVLQGFKDAAARRNQPHQKAYNAGVQVADMVLDRMVPNLQKDFAEGNDSLNVDLIVKGFEASLTKDTTLFDSKSAGEYFSEKRAAAEAKKHEANKLAGEAFLKENATKPGVVSLPNGLQYRIIKQGNGAIPKLSDKVKVIYEGRTIDGNVFDATAKHNKDADEFGLSGLIKGWQEAMTQMPVGSKWEIFIPYELGYGERGAGRDIPPYSALIFTLELVDIVSK